MDLIVSVSDHCLSFYSALGLRLNIRHPRSAILPAMADTGCQSCLAIVRFSDV